MAYVFVHIKKCYVCRSDRNGSMIKRHSKSAHVMIKAWQQVGRYNIHCVPVRTIATVSGSMAMNMASRHSRFSCLHTLHQQLLPDYHKSRPNPPNQGSRLSCSCCQRQQLCPGSAQITHAQTRVLHTCTGLTDPNIAQQKYITTDCHCIPLLQQGGFFHLMPQVNYSGPTVASEAVPRLPAIGNRRRLPTVQPALQQRRPLVGR